jgi:hypothetical protein
LLYYSAAATYLTCTFIMLATAVLVWKRLCGAKSVAAFSKPVNLAK